MRYLISSGLLSFGFPEAFYFKAQAWSSLRRRKFSSRFEGVEVGAKGYQNERPFVVQKGQRCRTHDSEPSFDDKDIRRGRAEHSETENFSSGLGQGSLEDQTIVGSVNGSLLGNSGLGLRFRLREYHARVRSGVMRSDNGRRFGSSIGISRGVSPAGSASSSRVASSSSSSSSSTAAASEWITEGIKRAMSAPHQWSESEVTEVNLVVNEPAD
ncbi:hypothetical protein BDP55DRAFT_716811 [Colletotrichum godetiae]|uniref:Uncharacterized protein n=1 Tax=Colletotrichum godetiae TaxID=1209918 RepID=A0AAJ0AHD0_9PEZI|nr:uncharacterized protein BDP55DRAFT_716811 [Colletotrichum godetiae]KAK1673901.1 hypothetical protein BDP55DRAFT_716811 [Colletotrichum godetiae]